MRLAFNGVTVEDKNFGGRAIGTRPHLDCRRYTHSHSNAIYVIWQSGNVCYRYHIPLLLQCGVEGTGQDQRLVGCIYGVQQLLLERHRTPIQTIDNITQQCAMCFG